MHSNDGDSTAALFEQYRKLLFSIAYRILGSAKDAEDIVQEAFLRWLQVEPDEVESPKAYLSTIVVRLCLDQLRSAREKREVYMGPELPEPLGTENRPDFVETAILAETLSFAFLILLESLTPTERVVFLLRDVFDYDYGEIAAMLDTNEANCRQLLSRARRRLQGRSPRFSVTVDRQRQMAEQFIQTLASGNMDGLLSLLADDVVFTADSNGKFQTARKPVHGKDKVARGTFGGLRFFPPDTQVRIQMVNGQPAITAYQDGRPYGVFFLHTDGERIYRIDAVLNPDKLGWL